MNRVGNKAEVTVKKAMEITGLSESGSRQAFVSPYRGRIQSLIGRCVKKKYAEMKPGDQAEA